MCCRGCCCRFYLMTGEELYKECEKRVLLQIGMNQDHILEEIKKKPITSALFKMCVENEFRRFSRHEC